MLHITQCSTPYGISGEQQGAPYSSHLKLLNARGGQWHHIQSSLTRHPISPRAKVEFPLWMAMLGACRLPWA